MAIKFLTTVKQLQSKKPMKQLLQLRQNAARKKFNPLIWTSLVAAWMLQRANHLSGLGHVQLIGLEKISNVYLKLKLLVLPGKITITSALFYFIIQIKTRQTKRNNFTLSSWSNIVILDVSAKLICSLISTMFCHSFLILHFAADF